jgi:hypothetical protein
MRVPDEVELFEYSKAEWVDIEAAVQVVRKGPLPDGVRESLLTTARRYRWLLTQPKLADVVLDGPKLSHQFEEFQHAALSYFEKHLSSEVSSVKLKARLEEHLECLSQDVLNLQLAPVFLNTSKYIRHYDFDMVHHYRNPPRYALYFSTLEVWWRLGGNLQISRNPISRKISGPLTRYFFAVTSPVMGASTPQPESLRDIIKWFKNRLSKMKVNGEYIDLTRPVPH